MILIDKQPRIQNVKRQNSAMSYWKPLTTEDQSVLYNEAKTIIICSINKDGTIHAVPIWFRYINEKFYILTFRQSRKIVNLKRNSQVSLSLVVESDGEIRSKAALIYGTAEIEDKPVFNLGTPSYSVLEKYYPKERVEKMIQNETELSVAVLLTITPNDIVHYYPSDNRNLKISISTDLHSKIEQEMKEQGLDSVHDTIKKILTSHFSD